MAQWQQVAFKNKLPQFQAVLHMLQHGRSMLEYEQLKDLLQSMATCIVPDALPDAHWSDNAGWIIAEVLSEVSWELWRWCNLLIVVC